MNVLGTITLSANGQAFVSQNGTIVVGLFQDTGNLVEIYDASLVLNATIPATGVLPVAFGTDPFLMTIAMIDVNGKLSVFDLNNQTLLWTIDLPDFVQPVALTIDASGTVGVAYGGTLKQVVNGVITYTSASFMGDPLNIQICGMNWFVATTTGITYYTPPFVPVAGTITLPLSGLIGIQCKRKKIYIYAPGITTLNIIHFKCNHMKLKRTITFSTPNIISSGKYLLALTGSLVVGLYRMKCKQLIPLSLNSVGSVDNPSSLDTACRLVVTTSGTTLTLLQRYYH